MPKLILHDYGFSSYSEKTRVTRFQITRMVECDRYAFSPKPDRMAGDDPLETGTPSP
jgi:hypothetical protein